MNNDKIIKTHINTFLGAVLAGILIGIGGVLYLANAANKTVGAFMFSIGLYAIVVNKLNLFTGKVGYVVNEKNKKEYIKYLTIIWLGNLLGTFITAAIGLQGKMIYISTAVEPVITSKITMLHTNPLSLIFLGIFCGLLMYIAVDGYKNTTNPIIVIMGVMAFILAGFEHCIADMFYIFAFIFTDKKILFTEAFMILLLVTIGNAIGGMLIPLYNSFIIEEKKKIQFDIKSIFNPKKKVNKKK